MNEQDMDLIIRPDGSSTYEHLMPVGTVKQILDDMLATAKEVNDTNLDSYAESVKDALDTYLEPVEVGE